MFVLALACSAVMSVAGRDRRPVVAVVLPYLVADAGATVVVGRKDPATLAVLPAVWACLHLAYGFGSIAGLWRWRHRFKD